MTDQIELSSAVILAGGLGTRLKEVVQDVPKAMAPINGRPFLEYQLGFIEQSGIRNVILATGYKSEVIFEHFGYNFSSLSICYSNEDELLGTGGGLIKAANLADPTQHLFAMNGDTFFPISLTKMMQSHQARQADFTMAMIKNTDSDRYSAFDITPDGRLLPASNSSSINKSGGIYLFSPAMVSDLQSRVVEQLSFEHDLTPSYFNSDLKLFAYVADAPFIDIGIPEDYYKAGLLIDEYKN